jgi:hypothetical protein
VTGNTNEPLRAVEGAVTAWTAWRVVDGGHGAVAAQPAMVGVGVGVGQAAPDTKALG